MSLQDEHDIATKRPDVKEAYIKLTDAITGARTSMTAQGKPDRCPSDVCECGEYRSQHDNDGPCKICAKSKAPYGGCTKFRFTRAATIAEQEHWNRWHSSPVPAARKGSAEMDDGTHIQFAKNLVTAKPVPAAARQLGICPDLQTPHAKGDECSMPLGSVPPYAVQLAGEGVKPSAPQAEWWDQQSRELGTDAESVPSGTWPKDYLGRAFVDGASWWQFHHNGSTMFSSEREEAEAEAETRFPRVPSGKPVKLRGAYRDGSYRELSLKPPFTVIPGDLMWRIQDATGVEYWFRSDDGTFDGTGMAGNFTADEAHHIMQALEKEAKDGRKR